MSVLNCLTEVARDGFLRYLGSFILIFTNSLNVCLKAKYSFYSTMPMLKWWTMKDAMHCGMLKVQVLQSVWNTVVVRDGFFGYLCYFILIFTNSLDVCLIANYFFLQYNANVKVVDHEGRNALWYAKSSGSTECVELLMNNGCPEHPTLPRRRGSSAQAGKNDVFEKLPASVI